MDDDLKARAEAQIELGRQTGADGCGKSPRNIYVIASELLSALRQRDEALRELLALPVAVRENRQRMDNARLVAADDGQQCAAWEPRQ